MMRRMVLDCASAALEAAASVALSKTSRVNRCRFMEASRSFEASLAAAVRNV